MKLLDKIRQRHADRKRLRKLRQLRRQPSPAGYTLRHFDEHQCVFIHIPKCAGVSVSQSLFGNPGAGHYDARMFRQVLGDDCYNRYFSFTFVRNPWDRLASAYHFLKRGGYNDTDRRWAERNLAPYPDFDGFVRHWLTAERARSWIHFQPQLDFLCTPDGRLDVDFIGRFENLEADFETVREKLGLSGRLSELNRAPDNSMTRQSLYNDETRAIVAEVYAGDIALLDYRFAAETDR